MTPRRAEAAGHALEFLAVLDAFRTAERRLGSVAAQLGEQVWRDRLAGLAVDARAGKVAVALEGLIENLYEFDVPLAEREYEVLLAVAGGVGVAEEEVVCLAPLVSRP